MRESGYSNAVTHTDPSPTAMSPPPPGTPTSIVAATLFVFGSMRDTVPSPQFGTQTLPNATARPEQGRLPVAMGVPIVFVFGSSFARLSFGAFDTHAASSIASQSGVPGYGKTASGFSRSIGILTPGVL